MSAQAQRSPHEARFAGRLYSRGLYGDSGRGPSPRGASPRGTRRSGPAANAFGQPSRNAGSSAPAPRFYV